MFCLFRSKKICHPVFLKGKALDRKFGMSKQVEVRASAMRPSEEDARTSIMADDPAILQVGQSLPTPQQLRPACDKRDLSDDEAAESSDKRPRIQKDSSLIRREWMATKFGHWFLNHCSKKKYKDATDFSIMSYNILSQYLLTCHKNLYTHCDPNILEWEVRLRNLKAQLDRQLPTIVCLQEVEKECFVDEIYPFLNCKGYEGIYKRRTGDKMDGCAVFWNRNVFESDVSFSPEVEMKIPGTILDRDNVALVVPLRAVNPPHTRLVVATTHLLFNPKRGDIKLGQLALLLSALLEASNGGRDPVIMCGDFNTEPYTHLYNFIRDSKLTYAGVLSKVVCHPPSSSGRNGFSLGRELLSKKIGVDDNCRKITPGDTDPIVSSGQLRHSFSFDSVYPHFTFGLGNEVTTHHQASTCTVDYIFYSLLARQAGQKKAPRENQLRLLASYSLPTQQDVYVTGGLPNITNPSDHVPLIARMLLLPDKHELSKRT